MWGGVREETEGHKSEMNCRVYTEGGERFSTAKKRNRRKMKNIVARIRKSSLNEEMEKRRPAGG